MIFQIAPIKPKIAPVNRLTGAIFFFLNSLRKKKKKYFDPCFKCFAVERIATFGTFNMFNAMVKIGLINQLLISFFYTLSLFIWHLYQLFSFLQII